MADINVSASSRPAKGDPGVPARSGGLGEGDPLVDVIELFFFAYRNFVSDPDEILQGIGFGRAHHRVLHFVNRHPGMRVTDLLDILRITKQSLGRVLRELVDQGFIDSRAGASDRRQRLLHLTPKGEALAQQFVTLQSHRIRRALEECGPDSRETARRFLVAMIDPEDRGPVEKLIARADQQAEAKTSGASGKASPPAGGSLGATGNRPAPLVRPAG
ncbi:DNA-binding MarR family transcriptional regulator [Angulomicrobium tetraedrale]|uniref:DNA-binding MarR family transcriptional regulator n=1 Tax=Ancylobacter tetraedralis TaxID=217068 RepID=A0A839ZAW8_9HYPH|nr:MarR family transcriptional regulator [Ancylobacter tetraedralis]MBB3771879.1 DNA-binding MarR family transcriptional regulator [Ancylobacter tetraedralis]